MLCLELNHWPYLVYSAAHDFTILYRRRRLFEMGRCLFYHHHHHRNHKNRVSVMEDRSRNNSLLRHTPICLAKNMQIEYLFPTVLIIFALSNRIRPARADRAHQSAAWKHKYICFFNSSPWWISSNWKINHSHSLNSTHSSCFVFLLFFCRWNSRKYQWALKEFHARITCSRTQG